MIHLFGVSFHSYMYVKNSIESILTAASEPFTFTVVDNHSDWSTSGTEQIREMLREYVAAGKIKRALLMDGNYFGWGLVKALEDFPVDNTESFFMLTDLDLIVSHDWIQEARQAHAAGAILSGYSLDTSNYKPPNDGFSEFGFGLWMVAANTEIYKKHHGISNNTIDSRMVNIFSQHGPVFKSSTKLYHQTWDVFQDDPTYAAEKRKLGQDWVFKSRANNIQYELVEN